MGIVGDEKEAARQDLRAARAKIDEGTAELRLAVIRAGNADLSQVEISKLAKHSRPTIAWWLKADQIDD